MKPNVLYLIFLLVFFPVVVPDAVCHSVFAEEVESEQETPVSEPSAMPEPSDEAPYLRGILFVLSMMFGAKLFELFVDSFEKGSV
ncbi:MAG: hypothetical protein LBQ54_14510 [Planctomycetaceae bacterium]|jgi:hypothetical protein|nr:hypothetical protein [Planctomycetaceae bacterium]